MSQASTIKEFLVGLGFKADENSLKKTLAQVAGFAAAVQALAIGVGVAIYKIAGAEAATAREAERLGTTTSELQALEYAATASGNTVEELNKSLQGLLEKQPGIKNSAQALQDVAAKMQNMNAAQRQAYAKQLGIDPKFIKTLTNNLGELTDEYRQFYAVTGMDAEKAAQESKGFIDEVNRLTAMGQLVAKSLALSFMGKARQVVEAFRKFIAENFDTIKKVLETIVSIILRVADVINSVFYRVIKIIAGVVQWFSELDDGTQKLIIGAGLLLAAWKLLNAGFLATPLGMVIAALTTLFLLVDDYLTYMEGGESLIDWGPWVDVIEDIISLVKTLFKIIMSVARGISNAIGPAIKAVKDAIGGIINILRDVGRFFQAVFSGDLKGAVNIGIKILNGLGDLILTNLKNLANIILAFFTGLWDGIKENFPDFAAWAKNAADSIKNIFGSVFNWLKEKFDWILGKVKTVTDFLGITDSDNKESQQGARTVMAANDHFMGGAMGMGSYYMPPEMGGTNTTTNNDVNISPTYTVTINANDSADVAQRVGAVINNANSEALRNAQEASR